jgi:hypothetical protein
MKVTKTKLETIKIKSFVTAIEQEKKVTMKGGSSYDTLPDDNHCYIATGATVCLAIR